MEPNDRMEVVKAKNMQRELTTMHYYGDSVRSLFIMMAVVMLVTTPFLKTELPVSAFISVFVVLVFSIFAGFTSPKARPVIVLDFIISAGAVLVFGHEMVLAYNGPFTQLYFWTNTLLSVLSLFALYFSSKTLRGHLLS